MEALSLLERKIAALIESKKQDLEIIAQLKQENSCLLEENVQLKEQLEKVETSMLMRHQNIEELNQEKALVKLVVDDLIQNIDQLVGQEQGQ